MSFACHKVTVINYIIIFQTFKLPNIFRWMIRIGNTNHTSSLDAQNVLVLDVVESHKHPTYDGVSSYYDIAILKTDIIKISQVINY